MRYVILIFYLTGFYAAYAQQDSINALNEVILYGNFSPAKESGFSVRVINDSVLRQNPVSLGVLLQEQANLYFKQYGNAMVSSISFRGTTAAQTGVYWNEIAVNSALNGQTDFNTINIAGFDAVDIRKGGGSVLLGSGAVGGAVNLRDRPEFQSGLKAQIYLGYGSYATSNNAAVIRYGTGNFYLKLAGNFNRSENDYPFIGTELKNDNGAYKNYGVQSVFGWKTENNRITLHTYFQDNDRNTSRTLTAESNAKLLNTDNRFLINWLHTGNRYTSDIKVAYLTEDYTYFFNKNLPEKSEGNTKNMIGKYDFSYFFNSNFTLKTGMVFTHSAASGSNFDLTKRDDFEVYLLLHHNVLPGMAYNASLRKGISDTYEIPFIYALDVYYDLNPKWKLKSNFTTNYRLPTFNDLYWEPGGNPDLKPENNRSGEFGVVFADNFLSMKLTGFLSNSDNMIQWTPGADGLWSPQNIKQVKGYGLEFSVTHRVRFGKHRLSTYLQYAYTVSEDTELKKQLIYVPFHKGNLQLRYDIKHWFMGYNMQYSGTVFTTSSNSESLDAYWLSNIDLGYRFFNDSLHLGLQIKNLFNTAYQSVAYRPMPNRNFEININYKL